MCPIDSALEKSYDESMTNKPFRYIRLLTTDELPTLDAADPTTGSNIAYRIETLPADIDPQSYWGGLSNFLFGEGHYLEEVRPQCMYQSVRELMGDDTPAEYHDVDLRMFVDEEGLYYKLPINVHGSLFYGSNLHGQVIVGPAYIFAMKVDYLESQLVSLPETLTADHIEKMIADALAANLDTKGF